MARHSSSATPAELVTGNAGDQPGAIPIKDSAPTNSDLPVDQGTNEPTALIWLDTSDETVKITAPDGSGGVATGNVLDLSASISLGTGDSTGLL